MQYLPIHQMICMKNQIILTPKKKSEFYLSTIVVSDPEITVNVDRHTIRDAWYVVRLKIVEHFPVRC